MKSKIKFATAAAALPTFDVTSRTELRKLARSIGVPTGHNKADTIRNLTNAIREGKLHFKSCSTFSVNPAKQGEPTQRVTYLGVNLRTYLSGPGKGVSVWLTPDAPRNGSPMSPYV